MKRQEGQVVDNTKYLNLNVDFNEIKSQLIFKTRL